MDYLEYGAWTIKEMAKEWAGEARQYLSTDGFRQKRDRAVEVAFAFQMQLVVGASVFFAKDATYGIETILTDHCDSLLPFFAASISALIACVFFFLSTATTPHHTPHVAYTLPWAAPLIVGVTNASFQSEGRTWDSQLPVLKTALGIYVVFTIGFLYFRDQLRYPSTVFKAAVKSLSLHPRLFRQTLLVTFFLHIWTIAWCVAAVGVYQWIKEQKVLVARTIVFPHSQSSSHLGFIGPQSSAKEQILLLEQEASVPVSFIVFFVVSLCWTQQGCRNLIQVATASAIGRWWRSETQQAPVSFVSAIPLSFGKFLMKSLQVHRSRVVFRFLSLLRFIVESDYVKSLQQNWATRNAKDLTRQSSRLSLIYLGFYGKHGAPSVSSEKDEKVYLGALETILRDRRLDHLLTLCNFAIAMSSASLTWLLDSSNSVESLVLGFLCGWISGGSLLTIVKAAADSNFLGVAEYEPDGNLQLTNMYFALKKELYQISR